MDFLRSPGRAAAGALRTLACVALLSFWMASLSLFAQSWNGNIAGAVRDPSGAVVPGVSVEARNAATGMLRRTVTDQNGYYGFPLMPAGTYDLKFSFDGFQPQRRINQLLQ